MRQIVITWKNLKLRYKFFVSYLFIILLTVLMISCIAYLVSFNSVKKLTTNYSGYLIEQLGFNLDKRIVEMEEHIFNHFKATTFTGSLLESAQLEGNNRFLVESNILHYMDEFLYSRPFIQFVLLKDSQERVKLNRRQGSAYDAEQLVQTINDERIKEMRGQVYWTAGDNGLVYMQRAIYDVESAVYIGLLVVGIDQRYLSELYAGVSRVQGGEFILLNEDGASVMNLEPFALGVAERLASFMPARLATDSHTFTYEDKSYLSTIQSFADSKWRLVNVIPVSDLSKPAEDMRNWIIAACLVAIALSVFVALFISKNITGNIKLLLNSMKHVSEGMFHQTIVPKSGDEVGQLAERFNTMSYKINEQINVIYKETLLKEQAEHKSLQFEYKALQAQMNPHFLYNTLESIQSMAVLRDQPEIGEMVYYLGSLLRESVREKDSFIQLGEELRYVTYYLNIQKLLYEERLKIVYELEDTLMPAKVPKLILQPIVENAIMHGIEENPGEGVVSIRCFQENERIVLQVEDNGVGMSESTAKAILSGEREVKGDGHSSRQHTRVGIHSVNKRIQILYGSAYGVSIDSRPSEGTIVNVELPVILESEEVRT